jgi:hypothetical protein
MNLDSAVPRILRRLEDQIRLLDDRIGQQLAGDALDVFARRIGVDQEDARRLDRPDVLGEIP